MENITHICSTIGKADEFCEVTNRNGETKRLKLTGRDPVVLPWNLADIVSIRLVEDE